MTSQTLPWPSEFDVEYWAIQECLGYILDASSTLNEVRAKAFNRRYVLSHLEDEIVTRLENYTRHLIFNCQKINSTAEGRLPYWVNGFVKNVLHNCGPTLEEQVRRLRLMLKGRGNDFDDIVQQIMICEESLRNDFALGKAPKSEDLSIWENELDDREGGF